MTPLRPCEARARSRNFAQKAQAWQADGGTGQVRQRQFARSSEYVRRCNAGVSRQRTVSLRPERDVRIPVIAVVGRPGSGKTRWLNRLLSVPQMRDTVVVHGGGTAPGAMPLAHARSIVVAGTDPDPDPAIGCLCCGMRSGVGDALRDLFLKALSRRVPPVRRVMIESGAPDSAAIRFTLRHAPFLGQRYALAVSLLLIDARDVLANPQGGALPSGARMADCVLLSHGDLMQDADFGRALAAVRAWVPDKLVLPADCGVEALAAVGLH